MVEGIERLQPQLDAHSLGDSKVLEQRQIEVVDAGCSEDVATRVAKGSLRGLSKGARVEPLVDGAGGTAFCVADDIRPVGSEGVEQTSIVTRCDCDRKSILKSGDAIDLPSADDTVYGPVETASETFVTPERQIINETGD